MSYNFSSSLCLAFAAFSIASFAFFSRIRSFSLAKVSIVEKSPATFDPPNPKPFDFLLVGCNHEPIIRSATYRPYIYLCWPYQVFPVWFQFVQLAGRFDIGIVWYLIAIIYRRYFCESDTKNGYTFIFENDRFIFIVFHWILFRDFFSCVFLEEINFLFLRRFDFLFGVRINVQLLKIDFI